MPQYRFSAFWLRSSVVSVLISLISDTSSIRGQYIKWIFGAGSWNRSLLRPLHASTWYCSTSRNGAPPGGDTYESTQRQKLALSCISVGLSQGDFQICLHADYFKRVKCQHWSLKFAVDRCNIHLFQRVFSSLTSLSQGSFTLHSHSGMRSSASTHQPSPDISKVTPVFMSSDFTQFPLKATEIHFESR